MCIIQERKGLRKIGSAEKKHGLYYLLIDDRQREVSISSVSVLEEPSKKNVPVGVLWHLRLGHLSQDRMICLNKVYNYIDVSPHTACDVCQMCRQKALPFPLSSKNAKSPFDLVHFDIWGPFGTASVHGYKYFFDYFR